MEMQFNFQLSLISRPKDWPASHLEDDSSQIIVANGDSTPRKWTFMDTGPSAIEWLSQAEVWPLCAGTAFLQELSLGK